MKNKFKFGVILAIVVLTVVSIGAFGAESILGFLVGGGGIAWAIVGPGVAVEGGTSMEDIKGASLAEDDLDTMIVKVRPSDVPLDTLSRYIGNTETVKREECGGYEVGTRDIDDSVLTATDGSKDTENLAVGKKAMWLPQDTILVPGVVGGGGKTLMLYVASKNNSAGTLEVIAANPVNGKIPVIPKDAPLLRLGKAMSETDAQTEAFNILPTNRINYTQIHMAQVEESVIASLLKTKVVLDFSTQKEQTIWEMRRAMELTNIFGVKSVMTDPVKNKPVYTSDGLWHQLTKTSTYSESVAPTNKLFTAMTKEIFDGNNGSDRRILIAGPDLIQYLSEIEAYSKQVDPRNVEVVQGIRFNKILTNFGELLVKSASGLFTGQMSKCGMVLDMSYIKKYILEPLQTKELDLDSSGQKRVNAVRLLETYALFAENLPVHCKIMPITAATTTTSTTSTTTQAG